MIRFYLHVKGKLTEFVHVLDKVCERESRKAPRFGSQQLDVWFSTTKI